MIELTTAPVGELDFTNPNGVPDRSITEREARLWLLSQAERAAGMQVVFDTTVDRWRRSAGGMQQEVTCEFCGKIFTPARSSRRYDSAACQKAAARKRSSTITGGLR